MSHWNDQGPPPDGGNGPSPEIAKLISEYNLLSFRLKSMEEKLDAVLDKISFKIDQLIEQNSQSKIDQAGDKQVVKNINDNVDKIEKRVVELEKDLVTVKITVAEKIMYGGLGGAIIAGLLQALKHFME